LEISGEQYIGKKLTDLLTVYRRADVLPASEWAVTKAIKTKKFSMHNLDEKIFYKTPTGKMLGVLVAATPLLVDGHIEGAVLVFRDVTNEQRLDEAKDSFISIASHQLRTPLTSMRWFSEMMVHGDVGKLTEQQETFIKQFYQGTIRMISLVNLLLQTARVEAGRVRIDPTPVFLDKLTEEVVTTLKTGLEAKKQTVQVTKKPETIPTISMDRDIVWQVIQNLLTNANRYSPVEGIIEIHLEVQKDVLLYSVRDHGIGIPKTDQERIFQKFFRAPNALKVVPEGSGLGLSLAKILVTQWGGRLWFETEEGKGTTFFFTVPLSGVKAKSGDVKIVV
jgi:signal transduction histidine kinase